MRHVAGFVLGLVLAAVALLTVGQGVVRQATAVAANTTSTEGFVWLAVGAGVLGLAAAARRVSPLVPFLAGAPFLALGVLAQVAPATLFRAELPAAGAALDGLRTFGAFGGALVVGAVLVLLSLVPQGRRPRRRDDDEDDDGFTAVPDGQPQAWRSPEAGTNAYPRAEPYQRPPLPPS
jgi:TRAP-type C4-dicarboxylate transport system permease small subunit